MVKIRLEGEEEEILAAAERIKSVFNIKQQTKPYKNDGNSVYSRIYIDAEMKKGER